jgi:multiple sugar transport system permease protein
MRTSRRYTAVALLPSMLLFAVVLIFPTGYVMNLMFQRHSLTDVTANRYIGIDNFTRLLGEDRFWGAAIHSVVFSAVSMAVSIPIGIAIALLIRKRLRGTSVLRAVLIVPMVLAPLVVGAVFRFMLESGGFVDWLLRSVGLGGAALLADPTTSLITVAFVDAWQWIPFVAIVTAAGMETLPREVIEAARLDGANAWQELWHFTLPMIRPLLALVALIRFMDSFREFDKVFIMTNGGPGTSSETLPIYLYRFSFQYYEMGYAAAVGFTMLVLISVISTLIVRWMRASQGVAQ